MDRREGTLTESLIDRQKKRQPTKHTSNSTGADKLAERKRDQHIYRHRGRHTPTDKQTNRGRQIDILTDR